VAHGQLLRVSGEVGSESLHVERQTPDAAHELFSVQALEHDADSQEIAQTDRRVARRGMRFAPTAHAGPAGQLERKTLQIRRPARFVDRQPA